MSKMAKKKIDSLGDDPQEEQVKGGVVANVVEAAVVLLQPVQDRLGEGHDGGAEADEDCQGAGAAGDDLAAAGAGGRGEPLVP